MDCTTLSLCRPNSTTRQPEGCLRILVHVLDSLYEVHRKAKIIHDNEKLMVIYCIERKAEFRVHQIDVFSKQSCISQHILHHEKLPCSPFCPPETPLAWCSGCRVARHKSGIQPVSRPVYSLARVSARAIGLQILILPGSSYLYKSTVQLCLLLAGLLPGI